MSGDDRTIVGVYRITHIANLEFILQNGIFATNNFQPDSPHVFIGDHGLTQRRAEKVVPLPDAGTLGDYIPFYFGKRSPMLYTINKRGKIAQEKIIYLLVKLSSLQRENCECCFTDGHAYQKLTRFFNNFTDLDQLDWESIKASDWRNTPDNPDRTRRKSAELLVRNHVPPSVIDGIVTFDDSKTSKAKQIVEKHGLSIPVVKKGKDYYY